MHYIIIFYMMCMGCAFAFDDVKDQPEFQGGAHVVTIQVPSNPHVARAVIQPFEDEQLMIASNDNGYASDVSQSESNEVQLPEFHQEILINPQDAWGQTAFAKAQADLIRGKLLNIHGIAMFRGLNAAGQFIGVLTRSPVSHIALDLVDTTGQHYLYEATGSPREIQHFVMPQVQIRGWDPNEPEYVGHVWTRQLLWDDGYAPEPHQVTQMVHKYLGRPYETDMFELFGSTPSVIGFTARTLGHFNPLRPKSSDDALFCSELVALVLKNVGYLVEETIPHTCLPRHFYYNTKKKRESRYLTWSHARLGPQEVRRLEVNNIPCSLM